MRGLESVLCSRGAHADDFLSAEVRADEGEAADPRRQRASGLKEVLAGLHVALEGETNAQHKHEIQQHDEPINERQLQSCSLGQNQSRCVLLNSFQGRRSLMVASTMHSRYGIQQLWFCFGIRKPL